jgi:hypothetical protein
MAWLISQALMKAYENSHSSPGPVGESSAGISSGGEPSVPLSETPMPQAYCAPDRMKAFSRLSRSGMTFAPLTADRGEAVLTWCLADSLAKTSAVPGVVRESTEPGPDCGERWPASLAKYDRNSHLWKTRQFSLLGGLVEFSETWPRWGTMRGGECWARSMPERLTGGSESGFSLPTLGANEGKGSSKKRFLGSVDFRGAKMSEGLRTCETDPIYLNPCFAELAMGWPVGWTDLGPLGTDRFQQWRHSHGGS